MLLGFKLLVAYSAFDLFFHSPSVQRYDDPKTTSVLCNQPVARLGMKP